MKFLVGLFCLVCLIWLTSGLFIRYSLVHKELSFFDRSRNRQVELQLTIRKDKLHIIDMPVAVIAHGNTMKMMDYSFLADFMAARGYLVVCIQNDNEQDPPLPEIPGALYAGRLEVYRRAEANLIFVLNHIQGYFPMADFAHLTLLGHSNGGDEMLYYAMMHPNQVKKVITFDNLRFPFVLGKAFLSFRSLDPDFRPDPGVLPSNATADKYIIQTPFRHSEFSDHGSEASKADILITLEGFLNDNTVLGVP